MSDVVDGTIEDHKKMVMVTGNLSDFQLENLKKWPYVLIDNDYLTTVKISYDFTKIKEGCDEKSANAGSVTYDFYFKGISPYSKEQINLRMGNLVNWTKHLFWEDTVVEIKRKGKIWKNWKK